MTAVTPQMQAVFDGFKTMVPEVELGGIYADKPGYHNTRAGNSPSNYSVAEFAADRAGPDDKAAAIDLTFPSAQRADYSHIKLYAGRLYAAGRAADPRTTYLREFFGQMDTDTHVEGYDFSKERDATSDSSHLWHIHLSVHRAYVEDPEMTRAVLSILQGETVEQWRSGGGTAPARPVGGLVVDGGLGPKTITRWQQYMGTPADGTITQPPGRSDLIKAVQRYLNEKIDAGLVVEWYLNEKIDAGLVVDGQGIRQGNTTPTHTTRALQRYLGTQEDGILSAPVSEAVKALQRRLNANTF